MCLILEFLGDKIETCIFLSYSDNSKAYKLYNLIIEKIIISKDIIFTKEKAF